MNLKNHPKIRKAFMGKVICLLAGVAMILASVFCFVMYDRVSTDKYFDRVPFAQAYNEERLNEDIYVFIDVNERPYGIGSYSEAREFYYVSDGYDLYIIECSEDEYSKIDRAVRENGSYEVVGTVRHLEDEVIDLAIEVYNESEDDHENFINRDDFDEYFQGVALYVGGDVGASLVIPGLALAILGIITIIATIINLIRFRSALKKLSEMDEQMIAADLDSPQTVYVKESKTYLTPRYLVSLGRRSAIVPYTNILWAYKFTQSYNLIPIFSNIRLCLAGGRLAIISEMSLFAKKKKQATMAIFDAIHYYNPQARLGYTTENMAYYNAMKAQKTSYYYPDQNADNNAV